jgi:hypothetical protein
LYIWNITCRLPYQDGHFIWNTYFFDSTKAFFNKLEQSGSRFSKRCQYESITFNISKWIGNRPNSDTTAKLVDVLWIPRSDLQNLICIFSHIRLLKIVSNENPFFFYSFIENGLKYPQISDPYRSIGLIVWSKTWIVLLTFRLRDIKSFFKFD